MSSPTSETQLFRSESLKSFVLQVFEAMGCPADEAELAASVLLSADLRGVDSHGVARLSGYVRLWEAKRVNPKPKLKKLHETPSTVTIDGDAGLGLVIGPKTMEIIMEKAEKVGTGWASVSNTNHFGIAGYHAMMALERDMIGMAMTNASPLVAPTHSSERMLGTNPIAVAVPANKQPAFVADFATTTAANGKLEILQRKGKQAPAGWIQDKAGHSSNDPSELKKGGALLPLGSDVERASHKGYCLGSIVDIFSAVLSGANYGPWAPPFVSFLPLAPDPVGKGLGHFFGAMRVDAFRPAEEFKNHMDNWIDRFRKSAPIDQESPVIIPGDPERLCATERTENGIPVLMKVVEDLEVLSQRFRIELTS